MYGGDKISRKLQLPNNFLGEEGNEYLFPISPMLSSGICFITLNIFSECRSYALAQIINKKILFSNFFIQNLNHNYFSILISMFILSHYNIFRQVYFLVTSILLLLLLLFLSMLISMYIRALIALFTKKKNPNTTSEIRTCDPQIVRAAEFNVNIYLSPLLSLLYLLLAISL